MTPDQIAKLPLRPLEGATRNLVLELADGTRFQIIGGKNRRPHNGVAGFTPGEMLELIKDGQEIDEDSFKTLIKMKEQFGPDTTVVGVRPEGGGGEAP
jgi:hypothetical protein